MRLIDRIRKWGVREPMWTEAERWRIHVLATYNSERDRGILHTAERDTQMAQEQEWYDVEAPKRWERRFG